MAITSQERMYQGITALTGFFMPLTLIPPLAFAALVRSGVEFSESDAVLWLGLPFFAAFITLVIGLGADRKLDRIQGRA